MTMTTEAVRCDAASSARASVDEPGEILVVESCVSTWFFSTTDRRFRRVLKGFEAHGGPVMTDWRPYHSLKNNPAFGFFVVWLDAEGIRLLRSWRHTEPCGRCGVIMDDRDDRASKLESAAFG